MGQTAGFAADASVFSMLFLYIMLTRFQQLITREILENQLTEESRIRLNLNCRGVGRLVAAAIRVTETTRQQSSAT